MAEEEKVITITTDFFALIPIQRMVNKVVNKRLAVNDMDLPEPIEYLLAMQVEFFEFLNELGTWKWWKHSHEIKRDRVLDELADCFAFFLSAIDVESELAKAQGIDDFIPQVESQIADFILSLAEYESNVEGEYQAITELITYVGTDNEVKGVVTVERFAIAIFIATVLFEGITWDEITQAYKEKSAVNIKRQEENY